MACSKATKLNAFLFFDSWITKPESDILFQRCKTEIPWAPKKWNVIYTLPQLAYHYDMSARKKAQKPIIEELIGRVEREFKTTCSVVWCNLFEDGKHRIDWHQDQYGEHLFVMSFGSPRIVRFRHKKTKEVKDYVCKHGDLYYFSPSWDKEHEHCVPEDKSINEPRISFAIFTQPPYSKA